MVCDICAKDLNPKVRVLCPTCARAALYNIRIDLATVLLEKETLGKHVEAVVSGTDDQAGQAVSLGEILVDTHESSKRTAVERDYAAAAESRDRVRQITQQADSLRKQIDEGKRMISARKAAMSQRRSDLESATYNIDERRGKDLTNVKSAIRAVKEADDVGHRDDIRSKVWHCKHAAEVAGLKQRRRRTRDGQVKTEYYIGGVCVHDLRDLNNVPPSQVTASLNLVAGLVVRVANYLAIRLPAEITLPHKDYPLPTVLPPSSSYTYKDVPFPGSTPQSSSNSPDASRTLDHQRPLPHPRPLYTDRKLPQLASEDPVAFSLFVEGVSLLAWDIAWLCRSQGISGFNEWEHICPLGKNVWRLLIEEAKSTLATLESENAKGRAEAKAKSTQGGDVMMGYFSHGTSKGFLGSAEGTSFMKGWKFQTPTRTVDKVKSYLLGEMQGAEWEVLDEKEWEKEEDEQQVTERAKQDSGVTAKRTSSGTTITSAGPGYGSTDDRQGKTRGTNGWMKLKSRNEEVR
ncbi:UV radiation resistance protein and autophagy-related subunit 14-domain-containing protein [Phyllosticta citriasiana]|uniref:UV radiation resistance protein and autophagy-related subunit 14-domain-containing protein n=1 Tax=Phyllosticta citriasiana TaxID=595635 RepID=UPI0030FD846E